MFNWCYKLVEDNIPRSFLAEHEFHFLKIKHTASGSRGGRRIMYFNMRSQHTDGGEKLCWHVAGPCPLPPAPTFSGIKNWEFPWSCPPQQYSPPPNSWVIFFTICFVCHTEKISQLTQNKLCHNKKKYTTCIKREVYTRGINFFIHSLFR